MAWAIGTNVQNDGSIAVMAESDGERIRVARVDDYETPIGEANAQHIVTAVNNFDDMVAVLRDMLEAYANLPDCNTNNPPSTDALNEFVHRSHVPLHRARAILDRIDG
jgi:hypothetical protein